MNERVLMVEDDVLFVDAVRDHLAARNVAIVGAHRLADARSRLDADASFDLVVLDQFLPDGEGLSLVDALRTREPTVPVLLVTAQPTMESAIAAIRHGVVDYLVKPVDLDAFEERLLRLLRSPQPGPSTPALAGLSEQVERAARVRSTVLILGETGTGKSRLAREIHARGDEGRPFQHVNCAAIPADLIEAELFGTEAGAFTGARERAGLLEAADGGTLFLDEIGELSLPLQAKLLHVLEAKSIRRIGGLQSRPIDVRFLCATHRDLDAAVREGSFRQDLLYRLDVLRITLAPLRERSRELPALVAAVLAELTPDSAYEVPPEELARMATHAWPGNLRELRNSLERAMVFASTHRLAPADHLRAAARDEGSATLESVARDHILSTLERNGGHRDRTATELGIGAATLRRKLHQYRDEGFGARIERIDRSL